MELPLVVGVDGSDASLTALDWAVDEAVRLALPLRIVCASLWQRYEGSVTAPDDERPAEGLMTEQVVASAEQHARLRAPQLGIHAVVVPDDAVSALLAEARAARTVVTGSSGRGAVRRLLLGSVSLSVAGRAHCPVVVVRGTGRTVGGLCRRVIVGVGDPTESAAAVDFALRAAAVRQAELQAVRTWRSPDELPVEHVVAPGEAARAHERQAADTLAKALGCAPRDFPQVPVRQETVEGPAHKVLVRLSADADLLVLGASRRHGHIGLQLGRVTHHALHHAGCPVAVVPHA
ncbi:universal stress protein [Streptomyces sp. NPDC053048]|uniref:universal stress protein n=1 Tax=Streptomyces sp. NPDC053048 TaxID=3365694 RepID=UPI0037D45107